MDSSWRGVRDSCAYFGVDSERLISFAEREGAGPDVVEARFTAVFVFMAKWGLGDARAAPVDVLDARPPGLIDPRLLVQTEWWVDLLRRLRRVDRLSPVEAARIQDEVLAYGEEFAGFFEVLPADVPSWLSSTPLVRALAARASGPA